MEEVDWLEQEDDNVYCGVCGDTLEECTCDDGID